MAKKVKAIVRLQIQAGKANPAPPIGPALAPHGVNIMAFCKDYNARTSNRMGEIIPADITIFVDGSFKFELKSPPAAILIKRLLGLKKARLSRLKILARHRTRERDHDRVKKTPTISRLPFVGEGTALNIGIGRRKVTRNIGTWRVKTPAGTTRSLMSKENFCKRKKLRRKRFTPVA